MEKRGKIALSILIVLIVIVLTSAVMLFLIKYDVLSVQEKSGSEDVLNAGFLPLGKEGYLAVSDFAFCSFVNSQFECIGEVDEFSMNSEVYFRFVVESTTYGGNIVLVESYRVLDPNGAVLLSADSRGDYYFDALSSDEVEEVHFGDYFIIGDDTIAGEHTLELVLENKLVDKKVVLNKKFNVK